MPEINLRVGKKLLAELDDIAEGLEVTRGEVVRSLLGLGLDSFYESIEEDEDEEKDEDEDEEEDEEKGD